MDLVGDRLFTPRLCLRRLEDSDLPLVVEWSYNSEAYGEYLTPEKLDVELVRQKLKCGILWNRHEKLFLIVQRDSKENIGTIHYWQKPADTNTAVMALKIALPHKRGNGYGLEAQKYVIIYLFDRVGFRQIQMYTDINNKVQQHCLTRLGFELSESLVYDDHQVQRTGYLYCLTLDRYLEQPVYKYHEIL